MEPLALFPAGEMGYEIGRELGTLAQRVAARKIKGAWRSFKKRRSNKKRKLATKGDIAQVQRMALGPTQQDFSSSTTTLDQNVLYSYQIGHGIPTGTGPSEKTGDTFHLKGFRAQIWLENTFTGRCQFVTFALCEAKTSKAQADGTRFFSQAGTGEDVNFSSLNWTNIKAINPIASTHYRVHWRHTFRLDGTTSGVGSGGRVLFNKYFPINKRIRYDEDTPATMTEFDLTPRMYLFYWVTEDSATPATDTVESVIYFREYWKNH